MNEPSRYLRSRYEYKYLIDPGQEALVRNRIGPFTRLDPYSRDRPDRRYPIANLYLDGDDLRLYRAATDGIKHRFKLRIRCYSDDPRTPVFLEVKERVDQIVQKRRAPLPRAAAEQVAAGGVLQERLAPDAAAFTLLKNLVRARPAIWVRYAREAYESIGPDPVRVTLDSQLAVRAARDARLRVGGDVDDARGGGWHGLPAHPTILEIKFTDCFPGWAADLVRSLDLVRCSCAKYVIGVNELGLTRTGLAPMCLRALEHHAAHG